MNNPTHATTTATAKPITGLLQTPLPLAPQAAALQPERFQADLIRNISAALQAPERQQRSPCLLRAPTGVGAKTALGVLSALPVRELSVAIVTGDIAALSRAPGIGKKTAQRIVLELKDKVEQQDVSAPAGSAAPVSPVVDDAQREAQAALQALGYTSAEAARAINLVRDQADTVDALIMLALRQIGSL